MAIKDIFSRGRRPLDGPSAGDSVPPFAGDLSANQATVASTMPPQAGRSYPVKGEDMGYLVWRKRNCCVL